MHIGFDVRVLKNPFATGVEVYTTNLLQHLLQVDETNKYTLFYAHPHSIDEKLVPFLINKRVSVRHVPLSNKIFSLIWKFPGYPAVDNLLGSPCDCFIAPHINIIPVAHAKKIVCVHDVAFAVNPQWFTPWDRLWHRYMAETSLPKADALVCVSEQTKRDVMQYYGIAAEKIHVISPGIDHIVAPHSCNQKPATRRSVVYVGTLEPRKNVQRLIEAFALVKKHKEFYDVKLLLCGKKGWYYRETLRSITRLGLDADVEYRGYVEQQEKIALIRDATVFVYPSLYEGFGFPPLEAMLLGTPAIVARGSSLSEVCGRWATQIDGKNIEAMANAMASHLSNPKRLSVAHEIVQAYSWDTTARQFVTLIQNLTKDGS